MGDVEDEKLRQEAISWSRSTHYATYNEILGRYQVKACMEQVPHGSILDIGCGDGALTRLFAEHYERVVAIDASSKQLAEARVALATVELHEALLEEFETSERFDGVFMLCLLEHVADPRAVLRKAASFLKDDGLLVVQVPNASAISRRLAVVMGTLKSCEELSPFDIEVGGHRRSYTLDTLVAEARGAGLEVARTGGIFYKMLSTPQMDWLLTQGQWEGNAFGWGRVGGEDRDWRAEFCRACYEIGKERPEDANVIYTVLKGRAP